MKNGLLIFIAVSLICFSYIQVEISKFNPEPAEKLVTIQKDYEVVLAEISAYTSRVEETDSTPFITAAGTRTRHGVIACPPHIPFGTLVEIHGEMYFCEDRMNPRYHDRPVFDIWMSNLADAREWGRRNVEVKIYN